MIDGRAPSSSPACKTRRACALGLVLLAAFLGNVVGVPLHLALEDHHGLPAAHTHAGELAWNDPDDSHPTHAAQDHERQLTIARRLAAQQIDLICITEPVNLETDRPLVGRVVERSLRPPDTVAALPSQCRGPPAC